MRSREHIVRYGLAVLAVVLALLVRWGLDPWLGKLLPFVTIYLAVALIAWRVGPGPASLAAALGYIGATVILGGTRVWFSDQTVGTPVGAFAFAATSGITILLFAAMHRLHLRSTVAGERMRATEERLRVASQAARMFTWETDHQRGTIWWSAGAAEIIGCREDELPNDARLAQFFMWPEDGPRSWQIFHDAVAARVTTFSLEFRSRNGERWFAVHATINYDESGEVRSVLGVTQDITARKTSEMKLAEAGNELRRERERLAVALRVGMLGVYEWRVGDTTIWWSPEVYPVYGVEPATFTPTVEAFSALVHPEDRAEMWRKTEASIADGKEFSHEYRIVKPDGEVRWIANRSHVSLDAAGKVERITGVAADVTEHHRSEAVLRASRDTLRQLVEQSPFGVYVVDADFRLIQVSRGAGKVFQNVRPLLGRDFAEVMRAIWAEPFASEVIARFKHTLTTGESYHSPSTTEHRADTHDVESYDWKIERITLPDSRFGVVCHFYDLSERQRYEQALREADRRNDEFLATLAHELRNPLAPIRSAVQMLRLKPAGDEETRWGRDVIERQVAQMSRLLDDLLDVSRITRRNLPLHLQRIAVADIVANAVETSRPVIEAQRHTLEVEPPDKSLCINGDAVRMSQVLANLLNNAAKYTPRGGQIQLRAAREGDEAVIRIIDNGIGIAPHIMPHIFEMFWQEEPAIERTRGGLGIGLSLVKSLVEKHGGRIEAHSEGRGMGSTFTVRVPALPATDSGTECPPTDTSQHFTDRRRVLVVDDMRDGAEALARLLRHMGHDVSMAFDGEEAIATAERMRPSLVLLDIGMPKMNGYEACKHIRDQDWGKPITIVALTGWGQDEDRRRSVDAGFDLHLVKPVDPAMLARVLAMTAERK